jgi:hypothetical protein
MTSATKSVWLVVFKEKIREGTIFEQRVAAWDLKEVLSFFNEEAHKTIVRIEKLSIDVTYHY